MLFNIGLANTLSFAKIGGSLTPETAYQFRSIYDSNAAEVNDKVVSVTTEAAAQVGNAGFEEWYSEQVYSEKGLYDYPVDSWWPKANSLQEDFWATRNDLTTSHRSSVANWYTTYPGTVKTSNAHTGSAAAEISTVGWGKGSTFTKLGGSVKNQTSGMLFIGTYNISQGEVFGKEFNSRPDEFAFYCMYSPVENESFTAYLVIENRNGENITELGRGSIISGEAIAEYKRHVVKVTYSDISKTPTHMYIVFMSSTADKPAVKGKVGSYIAGAGYKDSRYVGSVLTVDDVELIYE